MLVKVAEAEGVLLDWLAAKCAKVKFDHIEHSSNGAIYLWLPMEYGSNQYSLYAPSTDWSLAGSIIEEENITILRCDDDYGVDKRGFCNNKRIPVWGATTGQHGTHTSYEGEHYPAQYEISESQVIHGPTPLVAAMRCFVVSKMGHEANVPDEIFQNSNSNIPRQRERG